MVEAELVAEESICVFARPFSLLLDTAGAGAVGDDFDVPLGLRSDLGLVGEVISFGVLERETVEVTVLQVWSEHNATVVVVPLSSNDRICVEEPLDSDLKVDDMLDVGTLPVCGPSENALDNATLADDVFDDDVVDDSSNDPEAEILDDGALDVILDNTLDDGSLEDAVLDDETPK